MVLTNVRPSISAAVPLGLLSFVLLRPFTSWLLKRGWTKVPFTAQENTVAQTLGMAATGSIWCLGESAASDTGCIPTRKAITITYQCI